MPGICKSSDQLRMPVGERLDYGRVGGSADRIGHVDRVEIAGDEKPSTVSRRMWSAST